MAAMTPAMIAAIGTVIGAAGTVYAATRKPKIPGQKPTAPVPDDEAARIARERQLRTMYATGGREGTNLRGPGTQNVLG